MSNRVRDPFRNVIKALKNRRRNHNSHVNPVSADEHG